MTTAFFAYDSGKNAYFGEPVAAIEHFQPWPDDASFELVETSYFGFNIPEARINGEIYHWYHPKLGVSSGGLWIFQGIKPMQLAAEYHDSRSFLPMPAQIVNCTQPTGIRIDMLEPSRRFLITFADQERETRLHLETMAIMPLAVRKTGGHFTQAMRTHGSLLLCGREYAIDGYFTRDRSWGDPRSERSLVMPPMAWTVCAFDKDFAFHLASFDSPVHHPEWADKYPQLKAGANHLWGYVWRDGRLFGIKRAEQITRRETDGVSPSRIELDIEDSEGAKFRIIGTVEARLPRNIWENMTTFFSMARWECEGRIGYGDWQDIMFGDFVTHALNTPQS